MDCRKGLLTSPPVSHAWESQLMSQTTRNIHIIQHHAEVESDRALTCVCFEVFINERKFKNISIKEIVLCPWMRLSSLERKSLILLHTSNDRCYRGKTVRGCLPVRGVQCSMAVKAKQARPHRSRHPPRAALTCHALSRSSPHRGGTRSRRCGRRLTGTREGQLTVGRKGGRGDRFGTSS